MNTNGLVRNSRWDIELSKTGYISEAGRCLVMQVRVASKDLIVVLLDSWGKQSRIGDAQRIRQWLEKTATRTAQLKNRGQSPISANSASRGLSTAILSARSASTTPHQGVQREEGPLRSVQAFGAA